MQGRSGAFGRRQRHVEEERWKWLPRRERLARTRSMGRYVFPSDGEVDCAGSFGRL